MRLILAKLMWSFDLGVPVEAKKWVRWEDLMSFIVMDLPAINIVLKLRS